MVFSRECPHQNHGCWPPQATSVAGHAAPDDHEAWLKVAAQLRETGNLGGARATLEKALRRLPERPELMLALADVCSASGDSRLALDLYSELRQLHPSNRRVFMGRFRAAVAAGETRLADRLLRTNRQVFFGPHQAQLERGKLLRALGRADAAEQRFARVAEPGDAVVYVPILMYHGVSQHPRSPHVSVERPDDQLRALHEAGYQAITFSELGSMLDGRTPLSGGRDPRAFDR